MNANASMKARNKSVKSSFF